MFIVAIAFLNFAGPIEASCSRWTSAPCTCIPRTVPDAFRRSTVVAEGLVIAVRDTTLIVIEGTAPFRGHLVAIRVAQRWKGVGPDTVWVLTPTDEGICGVDLRVGDQWVIFATSIAGVLHVHLCDPNTPASRGASLRRQLGRLARAA